MDRRRWLIAGCVGCALLLVGLGYAWLASYEKLTIVSNRGKVFLVRVYIPANLKAFASEDANDAGTFDFARTYAPFEGRKTSESFGFEYIDGGFFWAFGMSFFYVVVPVALVFGLVAHRLARHIRRERLGLCVSCGYNLRESPERCPECGTKARRGDHSSGELSDDG